jgi:hypothetical protein
MVFDVAGDKDVGFGLGGFTEKSAARSGHHRHLPDGMAGIAHVA